MEGFQMVPTILVEVVVVEQGMIKVILHKLGELLVDMVVPKLLVSQI